MKKAVLVTFILLLAVPLMAQTARPSRTPRWPTLRDWILTGDETLTYKTLTSPTMTSPTITGTGTFIFGSGTVNGTITLENDETITNATDALFSVTFDDDATTLGTIYFASSIDSPNVANNDKWVLAFRANDDSSGLTNWVYLEPTILDASDESEDSELSIYTWLGGTATETLKLTGNVVAGYADAAAYWTITQANGGGVTFASTSDGTAGFTFTQGVTLSAVPTGASTWRGTGTFTTTAEADTVLISGALATDYYALTPIGSAADPQDVLVAEAKADTLIVHRPAAGASGLQFDWILIR